MPCGTQAMPFSLTSLEIELSLGMQPVADGEQQLDMFADRTSASTLRANQLRLYFASFAYVLMHGLRRLGFAGTRWANAQCGTLRAKLLKVAARVRVTARKVWLSFSSVYLHQREFAAALAALHRVPARAPPRLGRPRVASVPADARPGIARAPMKRTPGRKRAEERHRHREAAENPMPAPKTMSPRFAARLDRTKTAPDQADLTQSLMLVRYPG